MSPPHAIPARDSRARFPRRILRPTGCWTGAPTVGLDVAHTLSAFVAVRSRRVTPVALLLAVAFASGRAQDSVAGPRRPSLVRHPSATVGLAGVATALALMSLDRQITAELRSSAWQQPSVLRHAASVLNASGGVGTTITSAGLLGVGFVSRNVTVTQLGIRSSEALVISATVTGLLKGIVGRQRPFVDERTPYVFAFGRGFTTDGRTSMPSGHTTASFAVATALARTMRERGPATARVMTPLLYTTASLVGVARVYSGRHWASDVAAGAVIGTLSGMLVTRHDKAHAIEVGASGVRWRF